MDFSGILPLFGVLLRILAGAMFAEAFLTAVSFRVIHFAVGLDCFGFITADQSSLLS